MLPKASIKVAKFLKILIKQGWTVKSREGSHRILQHKDYKCINISYHDTATIGPIQIKHIEKQMVKK